MCGCAWVYLYMYICGHVSVCVCMYACRMGVCVRAYMDMEARALYVCVCGEVPQDVVLCLCGAP